MAPEIANNFWRGQVLHVIHSSFPPIFARILPVYLDDIVQQIYGTAASLSVHFTAILDALLPFLPSFCRLPEAPVKSSISMSIQGAKDESEPALMYPR